MSGRGRRGGLAFIVRKYDVMSKQVWGETASFRKVRDINPEPDEKSRSIFTINFANERQSDKVSAVNEPRSHFNVLHGPGSKPFFPTEPRKLEKVKSDVANPDAPNGTELKLLIADRAYKRQTIPRLAALIAL